MATVLMHKGSEVECGSLRYKSIEAQRLKIHIHGDTTDVICLILLNEPLSGNHKVVTFAERWNRSYLPQCLLDDFDFCHPSPLQPSFLLQSGARCWNRRTN